MVTMKSLPEGYSAIVFGSTGGIGSAVKRLLETDPRCRRVDGLSRSTNPKLDLACFSTGHAPLARQA